MRMRTIACLATLAAVAAGDARDHEGENLLANPSFESGNEVQAEGWIYWPREKRATAGVFARDAREFHSGEFSLRIQATGQTAEAHQWLELRPNTRYRWSVWLKYKNLSGTAYLTFYIKDANGKYNGDGGCDRQFVKVTGTSDGWQQQTGEIFTSYAAKRAQLVLLLSGNTGVVWWDDVSLAEAEEDL